jgi:hypothetical protein
MAAAALRHQRKSGEMGASGRLQKRTARGINFLFTPCLFFVCFLNTWKKQKQKAKGGRPGLALVEFESAFALSLACQKEPAPPLF